MNSNSPLSTFKMFQTPQTKRLPGTVQNDAGGYVFQLDKFKRLERFLILGVDSGTYYQNAPSLADQNIDCILECFEEDPIRALELVRHISITARAYKNDPAIFVLAIATVHEKAKLHVEHYVNDVCRTATHFFTFLSFVKNHRRFGKLMRRIISNWYNYKNPEALGYQMAKYRNRAGFTHRDALLVGHVKPVDDAHDYLYAWATGKEVDSELLPEIINAFEIVSKADKSRVVNEVITNSDISWEMVPTHLRDSSMWETLVTSGKLPIGAMLRNLGVMSASGAITPYGNGVSQKICESFTHDNLRAARIHPMDILTALHVYKSGMGLRGSLTWNVNNSIVDALDRAFYDSFQSIPPNYKRIFIGLDVSGSMGAKVLNSPFSSATACMAMAMVTMTAAKNSQIMGFSHDFIPLDVSPRRRLDDNIRSSYTYGFGATDCALPMLYALENRIPVDCFIVYTDNQTWAGKMHPMEALKLYRSSMNIDAKSIVVGATSTGFSIADPNDSGTLDIVGFDANAPRVIDDFISGRLI